jgi:hypothetical protein
MIRNFKPWPTAAVLLLTSCPGWGREVFPVMHSEPVVVRVLDGKGGGPQAGRRVKLTGGYDRRDLDMAQWQQEALTDSEGNVRLSNELRNLPFLRVEVEKSRACEPNAELAAVSVEHVRLNGLSGANHCGTAVAVDAPGVLNVFIKGKKGPEPVIAPPAASPALTLAATASAAAEPHPANRTVSLPQAGSSAEDRDADAPAAAKKTGPSPANSPEPQGSSIPAFLAFPFQDSFVELPEPPPAPIVQLPRRAAPRAARARTTVHPSPAVRGGASTPVAMPQESAPPGATTPGSAKVKALHLDRDAAAPPTKPHTGDAQDSAPNGKPAAGVSRLAAISGLSVSRAHRATRLREPETRPGRISTRAALDRNYPASDIAPDPATEEPVAQQPANSYAIPALPPRARSSARAAKAALEPAEGMDDADVEPLCAPDGD